MRSVALAVRAELTLAVLLVVRHRTVRFAAALAVIVLLLADLGRAVDSPGAAEATALVVAGSLGAVAAARLLGSGTALGALRKAAAPWWLPPAIRLTGVALLLAPVVGAATLALVGSGGGGGAMRFGGVVWVASTACAAATLALSPFLGASVSGALGLLAAWFGGIPPSAMHDVFSGWSVAQRPVVLLWNTLPLGWRATRWLRHGETADALVFGAWIVAGIIIGGWGAARAVLRDRSVEP